MDPVEPNIFEMNSVDQVSDYNESLISQLNDVRGQVDRLYKVGVQKNMTLDQLKDYNKFLNELIQLHHTLLAKFKEWEDENRSLIMGANLKSVRAICDDQGISWEESDGVDKLRAKIFNSLGYSGGGKRRKKRKSKKIKSKKRRSKGRR